MRDVRGVKTTLELDDQGTRNGVPLMPRRRKGTRRPTMQEVNRLRDE